MQGSDLDVFDVRLEQQMPARWQVGWNALRSLVPQRRRDRKIRPVWSSTPGGPFQQALPAAPQPRRLCWIIKTTEGWGWSIFFLLPSLQISRNNNAKPALCWWDGEGGVNFYLFHISLFHIILHLSAAEGPNPINSNAFSLKKIYIYHNNNNKTLSSEGQQSTAANTQAGDRLQAKQD